MTDNKIFTLNSHFDPNELIDLSSKAPSVSYPEDDEGDFNYNENETINLASQVGPVEDNLDIDRSLSQLPPDVEKSEIGSRGTKEEIFKEYGQNEEYSKIDPAETINLGGHKDEGKFSQFSQAKTESQIWAGTTWHNQLPRRYKIRVQKTDFSSLRYECFCSRQYLSYCALYQHMTRAHPDFLQQNKRFSTTNAIEAVDPIYGFKIKKIMRHRKKRSGGETFIPGQNLSKRTKRRIRQQSPEIQKLLKEVQQVDVLRQTNTRKLKIFEKRMQKQQQVILNFNRMIRSYEKILKILNIKPILNALNLKKNTNTFNFNRRYSPQ